jgi:hypothetical protein
LIIEFSEDLATVRPGQSDLRAKNRSFDHAARDTVGQIHARRGLAIG